MRVQPYLYYLCYHNSKRYWYQKAQSSIVKIQWAAYYKYWHECNNDEGYYHSKHLESTWSNTLSISQSIRKSISIFFFFAAAYSQDTDWQSIIF